MGELVQFPNSHEVRMSAAAEAIGWTALAAVTDAYGDGYTDPDHMAGQQVDLAYHNMQHTMDVRDSGIAVARAVGLGDYDQEMVRLAASAHDIVQVGARGDIERASAAWVVGQMREAGIPDEDCDAVSLAIRGTEPLFDTEGNLIDQMVRHLAYPNERSRKIALCLAAADMAELCSPSGPYRSHALYQEIQGAGPGQAPALEPLIAFQLKQLRLLTTYRYPIPEGEVLFGKFRAQALRHQRELLVRLQTGAIATWSQVIAFDSEFYERCREVV